MFDEQLFFFRLRLKLFLDNLTLWHQIWRRPKHVKRPRRTPSAAIADDVKLCEVCFYFLSTIRVKEPREDYPTCRDIYTTAQGGCPFCTLIWDSLQKSRFSQRLNSVRLGVKLYKQIPIFFQFDLYPVDLSRYEPFFGEHGKAGFNIVAFPTQGMFLFFAKEWLPTS
jgi:hypothetical protein